MRVKVLPFGLLLVLCLLGAFAQAATLSGTVSRSENDAPVSGATLLVRGTDIVGTTDANGTYSIANIPSGHYGISCGAAGLRGQRSGAVDLTIDAQQDFSLDPPGEGQVLVSGNAQCGGVACAGVFVLARQEDENQARTVSAADGSFQLALAPGSYDFRAIGHRYLMQEQLAVVVTLETPPVLSYNLTAAPHMYQLQGVVGLSDNPLDRSGSTVTLHGQAAAVTGSSDLGGAYTLTPVPAGLLSLSAQHEGYDSGVQIDVLVTDDRSLNWALRKSGSGSTTDPTWMVRGVVRLLADDEDGGTTSSTASGTRVSVYTGDGLFQKSDGTNSDGRFDILALPPGRYFLGASREGYLDYQGEEFVLEADQWIELDLEPDPAYDFGPGAEDGELGCGCGAQTAGGMTLSFLVGLLGLSLVFRRRT